MTTIVRLIPQWLRSRWERPVPQPPVSANKKDRQVLPALPQQEPPPVRWQDDDSPPGHRLLWRL